MNDFSCPLTIIVLHAGFIVLTINCFHCVFYPYTVLTLIALSVSASVYSLIIEIDGTLKASNTVIPAAQSEDSPRKRCGIHLCIGLQIKEKMVRPVTDKTAMDRVKKKNKGNLVKMLEELRNSFTNYGVSRV